jgi:hypothetical protein
MVWRGLWILVVALAGFLFYVGRSTDWAGTLFTMPSNVLGWTSTTLQQSVQDMFLTGACTLAIFLYFYSRFNAWPRVGQTPDVFPDHQPRFFTTWMRYSAWASFYGALMSALFLLIVFAPEFVRKVVVLLEFVFPGNPLLNKLGPDVMTGQARDHLWFLGAGLLVTVFFAKSEFEGQLRGIFQTRAMIPHEAVRIFAQLERDFFTKPLVDPDLGEVDLAELEGRVKNFLRDSAADRHMPTYHDFELEVPREQVMQRRLELLPRVEFMLWRLQQREFSAEVDCELINHEDKLAQIEKSLVPLRETALGINAQLARALDGLRAIEDAATQIAAGVATGNPRMAEGLGAYARVHAATGLPNSIDRVRDIPVSRLDDVAEALDEELDALGGRLAALNTSAFGALQEVAPGADAAPAEAVIKLSEAVTELRTQLQALLAGLTPLCGFGLKSIDDSLSEREKLVRLVAGQVLGFAICIALAASHQPDRRFFARLGLWPRLGSVRFRTDRAIWVVSKQLGLFAVLVFLIRYLLDASFIATVQERLPDSAWLAWYVTLLPETSGQTAPISVMIWLSLGSWFIAGPLLHGCYHGSAIASLRELRVGSERPRDFRLTEGVVAYVLIWSVSVIGLFILCTALSMPGMFSNAVPFTILPPVWGVLVAAATMRVSLDLEPIRFWREAFWTLSGTLGTLWIVMEWTDPGGRGGSEYLMWAVIFMIGGALNLSILFSIKGCFFTTSSRTGDQREQNTRGAAKPIFQRSVREGPEAAE